jgi:hypothetical protein
VTTKIAARVLLALGFLAASISYGSWIVSRTVLDPSATRHATRALLNAPPVRASLARELHDALAPRLGRAVSDRKLDTSIRAAVADPRFVRAFDDAVATLHAAILSDKSGRITLDAHQVTAALRAAIARHDPALAKRVRTLGAVTVSIGRKHVPHIGGVAHGVGRVGSLATALAILLIAGALLLVRDQSMIGRVGRRIAYLAIGPILAFVVIPRLLDANRGDAYVVAASILRGYGRQVVLSALVLAVAGISTWLVALAVPVLSRRRSPAEPRPAGARPAPQSPVPEKLYR